MAAGHGIDPARWQTALDQLLGRIAGQFTGWIRRRARAFVCGLLAGLPAELLDDQPGAVCAGRSPQLPCGRS